MAPMMRGMCGLLVLGIAALNSPANAQFYDLDGAYRCLKTPDPACEKNLQDQPNPPTPSAPPPKPNEPSFPQVLAWCRLNGIGGARDPVAAYWLYRQAAGLEVPHARENQIAIFERQLTPEQRQDVLTGENKR